MITLENYYADQLIKQYHDKPKAKATVELLSKATLADMVYTQVRDGFDVNSAVGPQLDLIGKVIGIKRDPLGVDLSDIDYRVLIRMKIAQNHLDHSLKSIDDYIFQYFGGNVRVVDNLDMTMTYQFPVTIEELMVTALETDALPRPAGVGIILAGILNPNGTFGFAMGGDSDELVNGYGFEGHDPDPYEGGTYLRVFWRG